MAATSAEKFPHTYDSMPVARNVKSHGSYTDVETARRDSRKGSVIASIKDNYGIASQGVPGADDASIKYGLDTTHRKLKPRHIQLIGIGGTIGTALYVAIGRGVLNGGPGSLFLAFTFW